MAAQVFDCSTEVALTALRALRAGQGIAMRSMFGTAWNPGTRRTWPQPISRSVNFEDSASWQCLFMNMPMKNNCEWLILITAGCGQILGCVAEFLLRRVEELPELGSSQTSCGRKAVRYERARLREDLLPSSLTGGVAALAAAVVSVGAESARNRDGERLEVEMTWWLLLVRYGLFSTPEMSREDEHTDLKGLCFFFTFFF